MIRHILLSTLALPLAAQDLEVEAPPQSEPILLANATLHPISTASFEGSLLFEDGKITALYRKGDTMMLPAGTTRVDCSGKHVYPGMIGANTKLGLTEVGSVPATIDTNETGDMTPEVRAAVAVNADATAIPVTRSNGVLTAGIWPSGGSIPGHGSVIELAGWTWAEMAITTDAGLLVSWPSAGGGGRGRGRGRGRRGGGQGGSTSATDRRQRIDDAFKEAQAYLAAKAADPTVPTNLRLESMRSVFEDDGTRVFISANSIEQIESAVSWARELGLRPVIVGGTSAPHCIELLARHEVPVMITAIHRLPGRRDAAYDSPFRLPAELHEAGVKFCIASNGGYSNERNLPYEAATAVAYGLPKDVALRAITLSAAEILGIEDQLGSLDAGKRATLIVTDGNPLELTTKVEHAFISGRKINLTNKHTVLAKKYREKYRQLKNGK